MVSTPSAQEHSPICGLCSHQELPAACCGTISTLPRCTSSSTGSPIDFELAFLMIDDPRFIALNREAELAKRVTCSGLSALRKASPARSGIYYDAFFGISIGLERLAKLIWLVDECVQRGGTFPSNRDLKSLGHNIVALLAKACAVRSNRPSTRSAVPKNNHSTLPNDNITLLITKFLSEFARGTRYFNVDFMVGGKSTKLGDPVKIWHDKVGTAILNLPQISKTRRRLYDQAMSGASALSPAIVIQTAADGRPLNDVASLLLSEYEAREINKQAQWKVLGIVRFLSILLIEVGDAAQARGHAFVPHFLEHFSFFCGDDALIRRYKVWPPQDIT
jgi:hypothetical protein